MGAKSSKGLKARSRSSGNLYVVKKGGGTPAIDVGRPFDKYKLGGSVPNILWDVDRGGRRGGGGGGGGNYQQHHHAAILHDKNAKNALASYPWLNECEIHNKTSNGMLPRYSNDSVHSDVVGGRLNVSEDDFDDEWEQVARTAPTTPAPSGGGRERGNKCLSGIDIGRIYGPLLNNSDKGDSSYWTSEMLDGATSDSSEFNGGGRINYPFLTKENTFDVSINKGSQGLGLSVSGGCETNELWPGLVRVKKLFPHQPAWQTGRLNVGDILLKANGVPLSGLSNYEALEVLRTTPVEVVLTVCRPPPGVFSAAMALVQNSLSQETVARPSQSSDSSSQLSSSSFLTLPPVSSRVSSCGEFELTLTKVNGSLGFTLRKEDDSILGHYVRALVKEPALSDGRIRPGDRILAVNGVDLSPKSHSEAVAFLRQCPNVVTLKLFRDSSQTPVSPMSPTEPEKKFKLKPLRKEAVDMLCDLAVKKNSPDGSLSTSNSRGHRRLSGDNSKLTLSARKKRLAKSTSSETPPVAERVGTTNSDEDTEQVQRPTFLDLSGRGGSGRKKYLFGQAGGRQDEIHDFVLDSSEFDSSTMQDLSLVSEPTDQQEFSHNHPAYQSANTMTNAQDGQDDASSLALSDQDIPAKMFGKKDAGSQGLLKWKGVVFTPDEDEHLGERESPDGKEDTSLETGEEVSHDEKILTVELNRGWSSRLGFSLQGAGGVTYVSAIYADSVAARDGRLKVGDQLLKVNKEDVEGLEAAQVIDIFRKTRGAIAITILRKPPAMPS